MSALLDWFDRYEGAKALNRAPGRWKCILGGLCPVTTEYGETPESAVENCRAAARKRRETFAEIARQDAEAEAVGVMDVPIGELALWER